MKRKMMIALLMAASLCTVSVPVIAQEAAGTQEAAQTEETAEAQEKTQKKHSLQTRMLPLLYRTTFMIFS